MKKKLAALFLAAVMLLTMAGCGGGGGGSSDSNTITVALWDENQRAGLQQIADAWSAESGVKVEFTVPGWDGFWTMLEAGVSGGEMPDVFWMHSMNASKYMGAGVLLNMDEYIANDSAIDMDNYFEGIVDLYSMDGSVYAMPKDHDTIAVIYNKKIFDQYGVDYPDETWTWEKYAEAAQEITDKGAADGVYGTYCNVSSNQDGWYNIVYSYGGEIISADRKSSGYDNPNTVKAMKFVTEKLLPACPPQDSMASTSGDTMFQSGLVAMIPQGSWMAQNFYNADNAEDYAWAMLPYVDVNGDGQCQPVERATIYNGLGWAISAETKKPDEAWALVSAFCSREGQMKQSELGITMAGYKGCSDAFADAYSGMDMSPFVDIEEKGTLVFRPYSKSSSIWEGDASERLVNVWSAPETLEDTLQTITAEMNATIAEE